MSAETTQSKTEKRLVPKLRFKEFDDTWGKEKIGNKFKFKQGVQCAIENQSLEKTEGLVRFIRIVDLTKDDEPPRYIANPGDEHLVFEDDLFMVRYGNPGILGYRMEGVIANNLFRIIPITINTKNHFFYYLFTKLKKIFDLLASSSTMPALNFSSLNTLNINYPTLPEQQKIATFLGAVDKKIQQLTRKKALLAQYKKGVMQQLFSGKLRFKDEEGNDFPEWEEKRLDEVAKFRRGSFPQPYGLPKWYDDEGAPFVQVYDVAENMLLKEKTKQYISKEAQKQSVFVKEGTLVLTIQGSIGRIAKTQYDSFVDRTLLIFQSYKVPIDIDYFKYVVFLLFEIEKSKAPGGTIKTITKEVLSSFLVGIPSLPEQQKIANCLSAIDAKIESVNQQLTHTQAFKKGLLQQMFV